MTEFAYAIAIVEQAKVMRGLLDQLPHVMGDLRTYTLSELGMVDEESDKDGISALFGIQRKQEEITEQMTRMQNALSDLMLFAELAKRAFYGLDEES